MESYSLPYSQQHGFAPAQAARDLCIPILKFSYAVSSNERSSPLGWIHLASTGNLMLSFHEATDLADGSRVLRVTKGAEILEDLDLNWLAQEAARSSTQAYAPGKAPVAIIVRSPCLAVRYPTHLQQIRRFQIKFSSPADFDAAVRVLEKSSCLITRSNGSSLNAGGPGLQSQQQYHHKSPAHTQQTQVPLHAKLIQASTGSRNAAGRPPFDQLNLRGPIPSLSPSPEKSKKTGDVTASQRMVPAPETTPQTHMGMKYPLSPISNPSSSNARRRPTNQVRQMSYVYDDNDDNNHATDVDVDGQAARGVRQAMEGLHAQHVPDLRPATAPGSALLASQTEREYTKLMMGGDSQKRDLGRHSSNAAGERPVTASYDNASTRDHRRRALQAPGVNARFDHTTREDGDRGDRVFCGGGGGAGGSGGIIKPFKSPLKNGSPVKASFGALPEEERESWTGGHAVASTPFTDSNIVREEEAKHEALSQSRQQQHPMANLRQAGHMHATDASSSQSRSAEIPGPAPLEERGGSTEINKAMPASTTTTTTTPTTAAAAPATAGPAAEPAPETADPSLQSYLSVPTEERTALLESWICRQLDNDGFVALCADIEGIWRRIGYGC